MVHQLGALPGLILSFHGSTIAATARFSVPRPFRSSQAVVPPGDRLGGSRIFPFPCVAIPSARRARKIPDVRLAASHKGPIMGEFYIAEQFIASCDARNLGGRLAGRPSWM